MELKRVASDMPRVLIGLTAGMFVDAKKFEFGLRYASRRDDMNHRFMAGAALIGSSLVAATIVVDLARTITGTRHDAQPLRWPRVATRKVLRTISRRVMRTREPVPGNVLPTTGARI